MEAEQKTYNVIDWTDLPREWKDKVSNNIMSFHNDSMFEWNMEIDDISVDGFRIMFNEYDQDPTYADDFSTMEEMIKYFGLTFEWYLANNVEFKNPKLPILINVCW